MAEITVDSKDTPSPIRIDKYLTGRRDGPSRSRVKKLLEQGEVLLNGEPAKPSAKVRGGDTIVFNLPPPSRTELAPEQIDLTVIHEDRDIIVFDKPAGLMTHPTSSTTTGTLVNALLHHCGDLSGIGGEIKPGIVHRLDKLTSGVMVAAKNDKAHAGLAAQFKKHSIERKYLAIAYGETRDLTGTIESLIARDPRKRTQMTTRVTRGRRAVTRYRTLSRSMGFSLIELTLETGRTHQIRVHLSEMNHPVAGDPVYGGGRTPPGKLDQSARAAVLGLKRQALHAYHLGFIHPVSGEEMAFRSPLPPDMETAASALNLLEGIDLPRRPARIK